MQIDISGKTNNSIVAPPVTGILIRVMITF